MHNILGFGKEGEQWNKLLKFIKNPAKLYENNKEKSATLREFLTFIFRLYFVISFLINIVTKEITFGYSIILLVVGILLAIIPAAIYATFASLFLNIIVKLFSWKTDFKKGFILADRIITYSSITILISPILKVISGLDLLGIIMNIILLFISAILTIIGVNKQYKLSFKKSIVITVFPIMVLLPIYTYSLGIVKTFEFWFFYYLFLILALIILMVFNKIQKPWKVALLNFFIWGLGYIYAKKRVKFGILLLTGFVSLILWGFVLPTPEAEQDLPLVLYDLFVLFSFIVISLAFAYDGYQSVKTKS